MRISQQLIVALVAVGTACCSAPESVEAPGCVIGEGISGECPDDMVFVAGTGCCIDRYELGLDASGNFTSEAGVLPVTEITYAQAESACESLGKFLCPQDIWELACTGGEDRAFPYGDEYEPGRCNGEDSLAALAPAGQFEDCEGGIPGLFDMSGNAFEWVAPPTVGEVDGHYLRGGMYLNSGDALACDSGPGLRDDMTLTGAGARCCSRATR